MMTVTELVDLDLASLSARHEMVLLEGCDGVGKTTTALALATRYDYQIVHAARTPDSVNLAERYASILARPGRILLDRSFISELVYGPLHHGRSRLTFDQVAGFAGRIVSRGGILIHLTAQPNVIHARLTARDGVAPPLDPLSALIASYQAVFTDLARLGPVLTVDTTRIR